MPNIEKIFGMIRNLLLAFFSVFMIVSCSDNKTTEKKALIKAEDLYGEWNNISLRVDLWTKDNTEANEIFNVERAEWESKLNIKPIRTYFRRDSTWNSAHYDLKDSLIYNPAGKWWLSNDTIIMIQTYPTVDSSRYTMTLRNDTASFEAMLDWDVDGKKDDRYFGKQIKVRRQ